MSEAPLPSRGNDRLLFGLSLGVLAPWLCAQTTPDVLPACAGGKP